MTALTIYRSLARRVFIDGTAYNMTAEDWEDQAQANEAARLACVCVTLGHTPLRGDHLDEDLNKLADAVAHHMGIDMTAPYGYALVVEPCDTMSHSGNSAGMVESPTARKSG